MRKVLFISLFLVLISCQRQTVPELQLAKSILVSDPILIHEGNALGPCEPSIAINTKNHNYVIAGSILDNVYLSKDGGLSWTKDKLKSSYGVYGDPVMLSDTKGNFYYAHLSNPNGKAYSDTSFLDRIVIQKSEDLGQTWDNGSHTLPRSPKDQDKHWLAVDPKDNTIYVTWTEFDLYGSKDPMHKSRILFSKSDDDGISWSYPKVLSEKEGDCIDDDNTTEGAVPAIGPNGEIYVAWSFNEQIYFDKSLDQGETWLNNDLIVSDQPGGWTIDIPGIMRSNGMPITSCDRSGGKYNGSIYVNWGDQRHGKDDTDIWLSYSRDGGDKWSEPVRVNNDLPGKHQFFSWMDIDQSTGYIYIIFYDRRAHEDESTDVYLAYSTDGGQSFANKKISNKSFKPNPVVFFGDYNDISAVDGKILPIWTRLDNFKLSVWTSVIEHK